MGENIQERESINYEHEKIKDAGITGNANSVICIDKRMHLP